MMNSFNPTQALKIHVNDDRIETKQVLVCSNVTLENSTKSHRAVITEAIKQRWQHCAIEMGKSLHYAYIDEKYNDNNDMFQITMEACSEGITENVFNPYSFALMTKFIEKLDLLATFEGHESIDVDFRTIVQLVKALKDYSPQCGFASDKEKATKVADKLFNQLLEIVVAYTYSPPQPTLEPLSPLEKKKKARLANISKPKKEDKAFEFAADDDLLKD
jgi:hypothetical protein